MTQATPSPIPRSSTLGGWHTGPHGCLWRQTREEPGTEQRGLAHRRPAGFPRQTAGRCGPGVSEQWEARESRSVSQLTCS